LKVFMDQMGCAMPRGPHPQWPEFSGAIQMAIQESLVNAKTPEQALKDAAKKVEHLLK
jgi:multiple sugar transport system substrate-binding protein